MCCSRVGIIFGIIFVCYNGFFAIIPPKIIGIYRRENSVRKTLTDTPLSAETPQVTPTTPRAVHRNTTKWIVY